MLPVAADATFTPACVAVMTLADPTTVVVATMSATMRLFIEDP
jgi:hypothetical protein